MLSPGRLLCLKLALTRQSRRSLQWQPAPSHRAALLPLSQESCGGHAFPKPWVQSCPCCAQPSVVAGSGSSVPLRKPDLLGLRWHQSH